MTYLVDTIVSGNNPTKIVMLNAYRGDRRGEMKDEKAVKL